MSFLENLNLKKIRPIFLPAIAIFLIINANIGMQTIRNRPDRESVSNLLEGYGKCFIEAEDYQLLEGTKNISFECKWENRYKGNSLHAIYIKLVKTSTKKDSKEKIIKYYILPGVR